MPGTMEALGYHSAQSSLRSHGADEQAYQVRWDRHQPTCRCWEENKGGGSTEHRGRRQGTLEPSIRQEGLPEGQISEQRPCNLQGSER